MPGAKTTSSARTGRAGLCNSLGDIPGHTPAHDTHRPHTRHDTYVTCACACTCRVQCSQPCELCPEAVGVARITYRIVVRTLRAARCTDRTVDGRVLTHAEVNECCGSASRTVVSLKQVRHAFRLPCFDRVLIKLHRQPHPLVPKVSKRRQTRGRVSVRGW